MIPEGEKPVNLTYRLRDAGGTWKVIDVIYEFVSQLATALYHFGLPFWIFTGDLIEEASQMAQAVKILSCLRVPLYAIPGNHEHDAGDGPDHVVEPLVV